MAPFFLMAGFIWGFSIVQIYRSKDTSFKIGFTVLMIALILFFIGLNFATK